MSSAALTEHTFTVRFRIEGATEPDEFARRVYNDEHLQDMSLAGPDCCGDFEAEFDRMAGTLVGATLAALADLARVLPEAEILGFKHEDLMTLATIARRLGRSHESVRLYARNKRGNGTFPSPAGRLDEKTEVWRWSEVAPWWKRNVGERVNGVDEDLFFTLLNDALKLSRTAGQIDLGADALRQIGRLLPRQLTGA